MALRRNVEGRVNGMAARLPVTRRCLLTAAPDIEVEDHREDDSNQDNLEREMWHRAPSVREALVP
jgi:hypothetical protein